MPVFALNEALQFPNPSWAESDGLLAIGGDLCAERLILAYESGIFPWFSEGEPILWWSPDPRCIISADSLKISRSMKQVINRNLFNFTLDQKFYSVVKNCQSPRAYESGTWITDSMIEAYGKLHEIGIAHSVEVWNKSNELVGGLYGLSIGGCFFGESMFSKESNASKAAFIKVVQQLKVWGINLIDCQMPNDHLESMGAFCISRSEFLIQLAQQLQKETIRGKWTFD